MASDVKFAFKDGISKQVLSPVTVSDELRDKFLKKAKADAVKLIPVSILLCVLVFGVVFLLIYFLDLLVFSLGALLFAIYPFYSVYNLIATSKAIKNQDYEFVAGQVMGKTDKGYQVAGLEGHNIPAYIGKKEYGPGETAIVARLNDELHLISE